MKVQITREMLDGAAAAAGLPPRPNITVTTRAILSAVAAAFDLQERDLRSSRRQPDLMIARDAFFFLARRLSTSTYTMMAQFLGGRDHSSAIGGVLRCLRRIESDSHFVSSIAIVEATLVAHARRRPRPAEIDPVVAARRVVSDPDRNGPAAPAGAVVAMAGLLLDLVEIAQGARELIALRRAAPAEDSATVEEIDAALTTSLLSMLDELGAQSVHLKEETVHAA